MCVCVYVKMEQSAPLIYLFFTKEERENKDPLYSQEQRRKNGEEEISGGEKKDEKWGRAIKRSMVTDLRAMET